MSLAFTTPEDLETTFNAVKRDYNGSSDVVTYMYGKINNRYKHVLNNVQIYTLAYLFKIFIDKKDVTVSWYSICTFDDEEVLKFEDLNKAYGCGVNYMLGRLPLDTWDHDEDDTYSPMLYDRTRWTVRI